MSPAAQFALARQLRVAERRAARRRVQLRQRPLLPRQAGLRAAVRAAAGPGGSGRRRRRARHHAERRPARRRHAGHARIVPRRSPASTSTWPTPRIARRSSERAAALRDAVGPDCEVVLLGSIASGKYVDVLLPIFGDRLLFPPAFVGRGDMSRGGLLLRCVAGRQRARLRADRRRRAPRPAAAEAGAAAASHAGRRHLLGRCEVATRRSRPTPTTPRSTVAGREVRLTNLRKPFWPELGITKGALIQYYADVAPVLLPHIARSRDGDEALSARRRRRVLLHEARAGAAAGLDPHLRDRSRLRQRHRLSGDRRRRRRCSG